MHVPDITKIILVLRIDAQRQAPFSNQLKNPVLHSRVAKGGLFRKSADKLVEKFFGCNLQMEGIATVLDTVV